MENPDLEKVIKEQEREIEELKKEKAVSDKTIHSINRVLSFITLIMNLITIFRLIWVNIRIKKGLRKTD
jgi:hypothetical protein